MYPALSTLFGDFLGKFIQIYPPFRLLIKSSLCLLLLLQQLPQFHGVCCIGFYLAFNGGQLLLQRSDIVIDCLIFPLFFVGKFQLLGMLFPIL